MSEKPTYEDLERRVQKLEKLISDKLFKDSKLGMVGVSGSPSINDAAELRKRAEEIVLKNTIQTLEDIEILSSEEIRQTFYELHVHQIELEMQNTELRRAQIELDAIRSRYFDLYDLAPIGYCTLSENGLFLEVNLATSILFGMIRTDLIKQPIPRFIHKEDQDIYYLHRKRLSDTGEPQACELRMIKTDGGVFSVHIESTAAKEDDGTPVYRVLLSDITERKQSQIAREHLISELKDALARVKTLSGLLPICSHCKKIRDDKGYWNQIEAYIHDHSGAEFSHSICQECAKKHYPDFDIYED